MFYVMQDMIFYVRHRLQLQKKPYNPDMMRSVMSTTYVFRERKRERERERERLFAS